MKVLNALDQSEIEEIFFLWCVSWISPSPCPFSKSPLNWTPYVVCMTGYRRAAISINLSSLMSCFSFSGKLCPSGIPAVIMGRGSGANWTPTWPTTNGDSISPEPVGNGWGCSSICTEGAHWEGASWMSVGTGGCTEGWGGAALFCSWEIWCCWACNSACIDCSRCIMASHLWSCNVRAAGCGGSPANCWASWCWLRALFEGACCRDEWGGWEDPLAGR